MESFSHSCPFWKRLLYVQGAVISGTASDSKKTEELEMRLKQERTSKEEIEQKYR